MAAEISVSRTNAYLKCPRYAYLERHLPHQTDYPRLAGVQIHQHIQEIEQPVKSVYLCHNCDKKVTLKQAAANCCRQCQGEVVTFSRRFRFQTPEAMIGSWNHRWAKALTEATKNGWLLKVDHEVAKSYFGIGRACLNNYWQAFADLPRPRLVEKRYSSLMPNGIKLTGVIDQVREVTLDRIAQVRPELVVDDRLNESFDPVVIIDYKSGFFTYDLDGYQKKVSPTAAAPTDRQRASWQYSLLEDLQPTAYLWLYAQAHQRRQPVWFEWCHLRSGKKFITWREQRDFQELIASTRAVVNGIQAQDYPKRVDQRICRFCDRIAPCRGERPFYYVPAEPLMTGFIGASTSPAPIIEARPTNVVIPPIRQLRLKVAVPRVKQEPSPLIKFDQIEPPQPKYVINNPPWEELPTGLDLA